jgi:3-deoxy-D-manno-octulosonate 8-phosphate phosphatase (KDO 8-P phosphatase)
MRSKQRSDNKALHEIARHIRMVAFDFDGVFTNNLVLVLQDGTEGVFCNRSDGLGLKALRDKGVTFLVISTEVNPVVAARCKKLNLVFFQGCDRKEKVLEEHANKLHIPLKEVAFLGNDTNDLPCLKSVGLPACVSDAHPEVLKVSLYLTRLPGGRGAVREFCDFLVDAKDGKLR